ncbi:GTPase [Dactylosporangium sp. CA-092794]|uniref:GTPase n=1 Tax=Dactylosporangium sp. CA-092794 TaxID=3239929 RepID=UPI003D8A2725
MTSGLLADAADLLRAVRRQAGPLWDRPLTELERRTRRPLQVAIGGPVSAGKSTLINALLGRCVAPVRARETAQVTTVYRQAPPGSPTRAWQITTSGRHRVPLTADGRIPVLPIAPELLRIEAEVDAESLTGLDLVDTPGLYSADAAGPSERGRRSLLGRDGEVTVYLLAEAPKGKNADTIALLRSRLPESIRSRGLIAVRSKADQHGGPLAGAAAMIADTRAKLDGIEVVAVSALLGQAAAAGSLGLDDRSLELIEKLAAAPEPAEPDAIRIRRMTGATRDEADRLIDVLGAYGVGVAAERVAAGRDRAGTLKDLRVRSGVPRLVETMRARWLGHADLIKAVRLLTDLVEVVTDPAFGSPPGVRASLAAEAERLLGRPVLHELHEWQAADGLRAAGRPGGLGPVSRRDAVRLLTGPTPAARLGLAADAANADLYDRIAAEQRRWAAIAARRQALGDAEADAVDAVRRTLAGLLHDLSLAGPLHAPSLAGPLHDLTEEETHAGPA